MMSYSMACWVGLAMESRDLPAALNHEMCRRRHGVIMNNQIKGFGQIAVGPLCECECHNGQNRSWHSRKYNRWERPLVIVEVQR